MIALLTAEETRRAEEAHEGSLEELMERAGRAVADLVLAQFPGRVAVVCGSGTQLFGASSIDVLGDLADGRPTMEFPDPVNRESTGNISIKPHDHCKITPG